MHFKNLESMVHRWSSMNSISLDKLGSHLYDENWVRSISEKVDADYLTKALNLKYKIKNKVFPTTFTNQIKLIADIVFDKYAGGKHMNFQ